jgi:hypothetical protein
MPVHFEMRNDDRLACWEFSDPWTIEELLSLMPEVARRMNNAVPPVYSFVDLRNAKRIPQGIFQLPKLAIWNLPNGRDVVIVANPSPLRSMMTLIFRLARSDRLVMYGNYDEAWSYVQQQLVSTAPTSKFRLDAHNGKARNNP